jgi:hypothetical protein
MEINSKTRINMFNVLVYIHIYFLKIGIRSNIFVAHPSNLDLWRFAVKILALSHVGKFLLFSHIAHMLHDENFQHVCMHGTIKDNHSFIILMY